MYHGNVVKYHIAYPKTAAWTYCIEYFFEDKSMELIADDTLARLLTFPNVLITSHQAFFTQEAIHKIALTTLNNFKGFFESGSLENEICYRCGKPSKMKQTKMRSKK